MDEIILGALNKFAVTHMSSEKAILKLKRYKNDDSDEEEDANKEPFFIDVKSEPK